VFKQAAPSGLTVTVDLPPPPQHPPSPQKYGYHLRMHPEIQAETNGVVFLALENAASVGAGNTYMSGVLPP
jgi:hypothetical protein